MTAILLLIAGLTSSSQAASFRYCATVQGDIQAFIPTDGGTLVMNTEHVAGCPTQIGIASELNGGTSVEFYQLSEAFENLPKKTNKCSYEAAKARKAKYSLISCVTDL